MAPIGKASFAGGGIVGNAPGVTLSVEWSPTPIVIAASYEVLGMSFKSFREPLKRSVQQVLSPSIRRNFDVGGRPTWAALTEVTKDIRKREGYGVGPILVKTGKLKRVAGQLNIWSIDTEKAYVSDLQGAPYGGIHQQGASFTPRVGNMSGMSQAAKTAMRRGGRVKVNQSAGTRMVVGGTVGGGSNTIPARPFLLIQDEDVNEVEKVFLDWVRERAVAAGFRPGI